MFRSLAATLGVLLVMARAAPAQQQQALGHKLLGGVGIDAGVQSDPGLYISYRLMRYGAGRLS